MSLLENNVGDQNNPEEDDEVEEEEDVEEVGAADVQKLEGTSSSWLVTPESCVGNLQDVDNLVPPG